MGFLGGIIGNLLGSLWKALFAFFGQQQVRSDDVSLGQARQARTDQAQEVTTANANEQKVAATVAAENASLATSAADPSSLRAPNPDSRD